MDITLATTLAWDAVPGADHYEVQCKTNTGVEVGEIEVVSGLSVGVDTWLTGEGLGIYQFYVRSVDVNGNEGAWSSALAGTYVAPGAPLNVRFE